MCVVGDELTTCFYQANSHDCINQSETCSGPVASNMILSLSPSPPLPLKESFVHQTVKKSEISRCEWSRLRKWRKEVERKMVPPDCSLSHTNQEAEYRQIWGGGGGYCQMLKMSLVKSLEGLAPLMRKVGFFFNVQIQGLMHMYHMLVWVLKNGCTKMHKM